MASNIVVIGVLALLIVGGAGITTWAALDTNDTYQDFNNDLNKEMGISVTKIKDGARLGFVLDPHDDGDEIPHGAAMSVNAVKHVVSFTLTATLDDGDLVAAFVGLNDEDGCYTAEVNVGIVRIGDTIYASPLALHWDDKAETFSRLLGGWWVRADLIPPSIVAEDLAEGPVKVTFDVMFVFAEDYESCDLFVGDAEMKWAPILYSCEDPLFLGEPVEIRCLYFATTVVIDVTNLVIAGLDHVI